MRATTAFALLLFLLTACESSKLEESCDGEAVTDCLPYEFSVVTAASATPDRLPVDALEEQLTFHVELDKCAMAPRPHVVAVVMRIGGLTDSGSDARLVTLAELRDDGLDGDAVAQDGVIDVSVDNPFFGIREVPFNTDVVLQFQARMPADCSSGTCIGGTCRSDDFEIPYRTGPRTMM